jgi:hypothetical protein
MFRLGKGRKVARCSPFTVPKALSNAAVDVAGGVRAARREQVARHRCCTPPGWNKGRQRLLFQLMRSPQRRRTNPKHLFIGDPPSATDLNAVAEKVRYIGSVYHKDIPSFAGPVRRPRPDASICPRHLAFRQADIQSWLKGALLAGHFNSLWEGGFPRYLWHREGAITFEARHISNGDYKGYPLEPEEKVRGLQ